MSFSDLRTEILENVYQNYPQYTFKTYEGKIDYVGCGCISALNHVNLALMCILPSSDTFATATPQLLEQFGWQRVFQHHRLKNELLTSERAFHLFSRITKPDSYKKAQSFIFRPEQLNKVIDIVKQSLPNKSHEELVRDILKNPKSEAHNILFDLTVKKLRQEKDLIVSQNWKKAKSAFCHFQLLKCIQLIWNSWTLKLDADRFIQNLKKLDSEGIRASIGTDACGDDHISNRCQLENEDNP